MKVHLKCPKEDREMELCRHALLLLWLTAAVAMNTMGGNAELLDEDHLVTNLTNKQLQVIPVSGNSSSVTTLVIEGSLITLSEEDRQALAGYHTLEELHLDGNMVTTIPADFFSVVPDLTKLSVSRNKISSLDSESFSGLHVLTELDLSHNLLTSLCSQLITQLKHLQALNLEGNPWNCSCALLRSIEEITAAGVSLEGPVICAFPEKQAGRDLLETKSMCSPPPILTTNPQNTPTPVKFQQSGVSPTVLKTTLTTNQSLDISKVQTPVLGHTWKFTACVAVLGLCTSILILCAIKGPSWYKLFHNYRHKRLQQSEDEDTVSTVFSERGGHLHQQTFSFQQENGQIEEEEDGYFEDPYIKGE